MESGTATKEVRKLSCLNMERCPNELNGKTRPKRPGPYQVRRGRTQGHIHVSEMCNKTCGKEMTKVQAKVPGGQREPSRLTLLDMPHFRTGQGCPFTEVNKAKVNKKGFYNT